MLSKFKKHILVALRGGKHWLIVPGPRWRRKRETMYILVGDLGEQTSASCLTYANFDK